MHDNGEETTDIVVLVDEEGNEHEFALVDRFQVDVDEYAILVPVILPPEGENGETMEFDEEAYIFRIDASDEEETLIEVEDEVEWNQVASVWEERMQNMEYDDDEYDDDGPL